MKSEHEYVRMLYVAATRAKRRLLLSATMKESTKNGEIGLIAPRPRSFLSYLWPLLQEEIEGRYAAWTNSGERVPGGEATEALHGVSLIRVPGGWRAPELPAGIEYGAGTTEQPAARAAYSITDLEWRAGQGARAAGVVVHALLQRIAEDGQDFWIQSTDNEKGALLRLMFRDAGMPDPSEAAMERAAAAIDRILADTHGRWLLAPHQAAECELALTGFDGEAVVAVKIDRSFVDDDGVRWIIDYKTATHEGADLEEFLAGQERIYRPQLERYVRMMREWDTRPIRAALYFPLLQRWREVDL